MPPFREIPPYPVSLCDSSLANTSSVGTRGWGSGWRGEGQAPVPGAGSLRGGRWHTGAGDGRAWHVHLFLWGLQGRLALLLPVRDGEAGVQRGTRREDFAFPLLKPPGFCLVSSGEGSNSGGSHARLLDEKPILKGRVWTDFNILNTDRRQTPVSDSRGGPSVAAAHVGPTWARE